MPEKRKPIYVPPPSGNFNLLRQIWEQIRLAWALMLDARVPYQNKIVPILAIAYAISPIDLMPDILLGVGWLDDIGIVILALIYFISIAPADVAAERLRRIRHNDKYRVRRDKDGGITIDVKAEPVDESDDEPGKTYDAQSQKRRSRLSEEERTEEPYVDNDEARPRRSNRTQR